MIEYTPNRYLCCDARLPLVFNYCPNCGSEVPRRPDTQEDIDERKRLSVIKGCQTRIEGLKERIQDLIQNHWDYDKVTGFGSSEEQIGYAEKEIEAYSKKLRQLLQ